VRRNGSLTATLSVAVVVVVASGAAPAGASGLAASSPTPPVSLTDAVRTVEVLNDRVTGLGTTVAGLQGRLDRESRALRRSADRVARLRAGLTAEVARLPAQGTLRRGDVGRVRSARERLRAGVRRLRARQTAIAGDPVVRRLARAQRSLVRLTAQRDAALATVTTLEGAALAAGDVAAGSLTYGTWADAFLRAAGVPVCSNNLITVIAWESAESTDAAFNPLATTLPAPGATDFNSAGVKNYPSAAVGLAATLDTLRYGSDRFGYAPVLAALGACAPPELTAAAVNASMWCRGCAGGTYVVGRISAVEANLAGYSEST
jgi:hypothetical protein